MRVVTKSISPRAFIVRHQEAPKPTEPEPEPDIWSVWDREDGLERAVRSADELLRVGACA